jgi:hypothetical protein
MPLLMQIEPVSFSQLGTWVAIGAMVYVLYLKWDANRIERDKASKPQSTVISPQPLIVEMGKQFATKQELMELEHKFETFRETILAKIDDKFTALDNKRSRDVAKLHDDIREVSEHVQRLIGKMEK